MGKYLEIFHLWHTHVFDGCSIFYYNSTLNCSGRFDKKTKTFLSFFPMLHKKQEMTAVISCFCIFLWWRFRHECAVPLC